jgi:ATP-dependent 26S proteasome regulatory subunit
VNNKNRLDDALLRPGRIDELILIDKMDEEVVKHVLGEYVDGYDLVKDWPIAFINEYVVRRTYLSVKDAADSVTELANRVAELDDYRESDKDDIARMMATFKKKMKKGRKNSDVHPPVVVDEDDDEDYDK